MKRAVYCRYCGEKGHNRRSCPSLKKQIEDNPNSWSSRMLKERQESYKAKSCSYCKGEGHTRKTCEIRKKDLPHIQKAFVEFRQDLLKFCVKTGLMPGSLVHAQFSEGTTLMLLTGFQDFERSRFGPGKTGHSISLIFKYQIVAQKVTKEYFAHGPARDKLPLNLGDFSDLSKYGIQPRRMSENLKVEVLSSGGMNLQELTNFVQRTNPNWLTANDITMDLVDEHSSEKSPRRGQIRSLFNIWVNDGFLRVIPASYDEEESPRF